MSKPALALPDSPELPAEISSLLKSILFNTNWGRNIVVYLDHTPKTKDEAAKLQARIDAITADLASLRSVIAKHLLTAEEAKALLAVRCGFGDAAFVHPDTFASAVKSLRRLSGSSRGEE